MEPNPPAAASSRRHRSRQRECLLAHLRSTSRHPTAAQIHSALQPMLPDLALATVYRNLEILVAEGLVAEVPTTSGGLRYDGNLDAHDHFDCERCGRLVDVPPSAPERLARQLEKRLGLRARRVRIAFVGICPACTKASSPAPDQARSTRSSSPRRRGRDRSRDPS